MVSLREERRIIRLVEREMKDTKTEVRTSKKKIKFKLPKSPFLLADEAAEYLRMDPNTLKNHRVSKTGPRYRKHGGKICYHKKDLRFWSEQHDCNSKFVPTQNA